MAIIDQDDIHFQEVTEDPVDIEKLVKVCRLTFTETFGADNTDEDLKEFLDKNYNADVLKKELSSDESKTYFYDIHGIIAGYLKVNWDSAQTESDYPDAMEIQRIYVTKRFQKMHIGGRLMKKALKIAEDLGKKQVWLGVWEHNQNALGFYSHYGFKKIGQHEFVVGDDHQTDYIYSKNL